MVDIVQIIKASAQLTNMVIRPNEYKEKRKRNYERRKNLTPLERYNEDIGRVYKSMR